MAAMAMLGQSRREAHSAISINRSIGADDDDDDDDGDGEGREDRVFHTYCRSLTEAFWSSRCTLSCSARLCMYVCMHVG